VKFIKDAEKIFSRPVVQRDGEWSKRRDLTQKDRKRHRQSDNFRPASKTVGQSGVKHFWDNRCFKMREDPVISDRVRVSGGSTEGSLGR
jgi:hypothetical protein